MRAHDVAPISDEPLATRARGVQRDEEQRDEPEAAQDDRGRLGEELAGEEVQQLREGQIDPGQNAGGHEIGEEEHLVGLVVADEPPQHLGGGDVGVCFLGCVDNSGHRPILALWEQFRCRSHHAFTTLRRIAAMLRKRPPATTVVREA